MHAAPLKRKATLGVLGAFGLGRFVVTGQQPAPNGVFTTHQAEAGRTAYERARDLPT